MKRILLSIISFFFCLLSFADIVLNDFATFTKDKRLEIHYEYTVTANKKTFQGKGVLLYQDGAFKYDDGSTKLYNDKESFWSVNLSAREITIEPGITLDLMSDQSTILRYLGINPKGATIKPMFSEEGSPKGFSVMLKDNTAVDVKIPYIKMIPTGPLADFSLNLSKPDPSLKYDASWVVTDLR